MPFTALDGLFHRIVPHDRAATALAPAVSPEGRFHHDAQPSLYVSPRPDWAEHAIKTYIRNDDPPRVICELRVTGAKVLDLRCPDHCAQWKIDPRLAAVPWLLERAQGLPASTWTVSDRARASGADGMIYTARSEPTRWHLVLAAATAGSLLLAPVQFARGHFAGAVNMDWRQVLTQRKNILKTNRSLLTATPAQPPTGWTCSEPCRASTAFGCRMGGRALQAHFSAHFGSC